MPESVLDRENDRRPVQLLCDPRSSEADDTLVPALSGDDNEMETPVIRGLGECKLGDLLLHLLPLAVAAVKNSRELSRLHEILLFEKFDHVLRNVHSTGGVYPRSDAKADVIARHI